MIISAIPTIFYESFSYRLFTKLSYIEFVLKQKADTLLILEKIAKLERQKDDFIAVASHELKTPLTSVKAYTHLLKSRAQKANDAESLRYVEKVNNQLDKMITLINDLLDITKIDSGRLRLNNEYFSMKDLVEEAVADEKENSNRKIIAKTQNSKDIYGDKERILQVLHNFLTNAIKYSPSDKKIIVSMKANNKQVTVCVQDFGIGISKENQETIFQRFYREGGEMESTFPGMGIGLYISSEIVMRHNGRIWVESKKGKGSKFYFSLPLQLSLL